MVTAFKNVQYSSCNGLIISRHTRMEGGNLDLGFGSSTSKFNWFSMQQWDF